MQDLSRDEIHDIRAMLEDYQGGNLSHFSEREVIALLQVAKWYDAFRGASLVGSVFVRAIKWSLMFVGLLIAVKAGFIEWIAQELENMRGK